MSHDIYTYIYNILEPSGLFSYPNRSKLFIWWGFFTDLLFLTVKQEMWFYHDPGKRGKCHPVQQCVWLRCEQSLDTNGELYTERNNQAITTQTILGSRMHSLLVWFFPRDLLTIRYPKTFSLRSESWWGLSSLKTTKSVLHLKLYMLVFRSICLIRDDREYA